LRRDGSGASSLLRRDGSGVPAKRQQSSGETAEDFRRSGELCQTATIGDHDEVVEALFMCVSMGPACKVLVGLLDRKVWVGGGEIRSTRVEIVWDSVLGLAPASAWAYHLPLRFGHNTTKRTCIRYVALKFSYLYQVHVVRKKLSGFNCHILTYLEVCPHINTLQCPPISQW
jgi:hypothetical protein